MISFGSGYVATDQPWASRFAITPLGLLSGSATRLAVTPSGCNAFGPIGWASDYLLEFLQTVAVEAVVLLPLLRSHGPMTWLNVVLLANLTTHPIVYFGLPCAFETYLKYLVTAEAFAPVTEVALLLTVVRPKSVRAALLMSVLVLVANLLSWQLGPLLP